jgi:hypothetical protein
MRSLHARAGVAAILVVLSCIAVLCALSGGSVNLEEVSSDGFTSAEKAQLKHIGKDAVIEDQQHREDLKEQPAKDQAAEVAKLEEHKKKAEELVKRPHYGSNCLTLKAYAVASYDRLEDARDALPGFINILYPILSQLAEDKDKHNTREECTTFLTELLDKLEEDPDIQFEDSIALKMLKVVKTQIMEKRGILLSTDLQGHKGSDQATLALERHGAVDLAKNRHGGQYMFIDAERVGWSGTPGIFQHLAVRTIVVDTAAREMAKTTDAKEFVFTPIYTHDKPPWNPSPEEARIFREWKGSM